NAPCKRGGRPVGTFFAPGDVTVTPDDLRDILARGLRRLADDLDPPMSGPENLPNIQRRILAVLTYQPALGKVIAKRINRKYSSYVRFALAALVRARLARQTADGYSLP